MTGKILVTELFDKTVAILLRENTIIEMQACECEAYNVGDIYIGKVQTVSPNIGAAFLDLGGGYITYMPLSEQYNAYITNRDSEEKIRVGDEILVQITKMSIKTKLPTVTADISLAGLFSVIKRKDIKDSSSADILISSKIPRAKRKRFKESERLTKLANRFSVMVRTNAESVNENILTVEEEAEVLADRLEHILKIAKSRTCYSRLYQSPPPYIDFIKNCYQSEYEEIVTDKRSLYEEIDSCFGQKKIRLYQDEMLPLYKLYALEARVDELLQKKVWLRSGGYLVIEQTEALVAIDVNTGKNDKGKEKEETFFKLNKEAAEMIALHLRARNLSGMIIVDFINMKSKAKEEELFQYMNLLLKKDPVKAKAIDVTALGLMEITRKKIAPTISVQLKPKNV